MSKEKERNDEEWTKIDVKKETRDKLQAYKYTHHYHNLDEIIRELMTREEKNSRR
jgi:hypothetical protein